MKMRRIYNIICFAVLSVLTLSCSKENIIAGTDAAILSCEVASHGVAVDAFITGDEIHASMPLTAELDDVVVNLQLSEGAIVEPDPTLVVKLDQPVQFTVTSADGTGSRVYTLSASIDEDNVLDANVKVGNMVSLVELADAGYTVLGGLFIFDDGSGDVITDLSPLNRVTEIKTDLELWCSGLDSLEMKSLRTVGNVDLYTNTSSSISFPSLENVAGRFRIGNDDSGVVPTENDITERIYLPKLKRVGKSFIVFLCAALEDLHTPVLESVGEDFKVQGGKFTDLSMMSKLTKVRGMVSIFGKLNTLKGFNIETADAVELELEEVTDLSPLSVLKKADYMKLIGNKEITSFKGLENIELNAMDIINFPSVKTTEFLPVRNGMEHIMLQQMDNMEELTGFEKVTDVETLILMSFYKIKNLDPIANLTHVNRLQLMVFEELEELPEFKNLTELGGPLMVSMMRNLKSLEGLSHIKSVGSLQVDNLLTIPSLKGLEGLEKVTEAGVLIGFNNMITDLEPLRNLKEVALKNQSDQIRIEKNAELYNFAAVQEVCLKYWMSGGGKFAKVSIAENKYNPSYQDMVDGRVCPEEN